MFLKNIFLSDCTTYKIGGWAKYFIEAKNEKDITDILSECRKNNDLKNEKIFILGGGANVLFSDEGYNGIVLKISIKKTEIIRKGIIEAGAGTNLNDLVFFAAEHNLSGLEWAAGIPGSFGGAIRGNAGAFGGEIKDCLIAVKSVNLKQPEKIILRKKTDDMFGYRTSIFKSKYRDEIILSGIIKLCYGDCALIKEKMENNARYRKEKQPLEWPSAGSVFKNVDARKLASDQKKEWGEFIKTDPMPVIPAAILILKAGLSGKSFGDAVISEKHSNFFVNKGKAKAEDVKKLIFFAKQTIREKFGIEMEEEIQIVDY